MINIGNGNKIRNSNIFSGQLSVGQGITVNGKKIPCPPGNGHIFSTINGKVFSNGYEYKNGEWVKTLSAIWHKYF